MTARTSKFRRDVEEEPEHRRRRQRMEHRVLEQTLEKKLARARLVCVVDGAHLAQELSVTNAEHAAAECRRRLDGAETEERDVGGVVAVVSRAIVRLGAILPRIHNSSQLRG